MKRAFSAFSQTAWRASYSNVVSCRQKTTDRPDVHRTVYYGLGAIDADEPDEPEAIADDELADLDEHPLLGENKG